MFEEFVAAENLLDRAGLLDAKLPIPLEAVTDYLAEEGLKLHYYDPRQAPEPIKEAAYSVDEVLVRQEEGALLFVNQTRPWTRRRFSVFHGIGHYLLPDHRGLNYLARGCSTMKPLTKKPYERQADRFAAGLNMPSHRFRLHMAQLPFSILTVQQLAKLYSASVESAAIHYIDLADVPCALVRFDRVKGKNGSRGFDSPYKLRYQVSNALFPFRIQPGIILQEFPDQILSWKNWEGQYMPEGVITGERMGLGAEVILRLYSCYIDELCGVIALVYPGSTEPLSVIDISKTI